MDLDVSECDGDAPIVKNQLAIIAQFLGAVTRIAEINTCGGVGVDIIKPLDKCISIKVVVYYPYDVNTLNLEKLLRKPRYSDMERLDMFALLKSILPAGSILWI